MKTAMFLMTILWIALTAAMTFGACVFVVSGFNIVVGVFLLVLVAIGILLNIAAHTKLRREYKIIKKE